MIHATKIVDALLWPIRVVYLAIGFTLVFVSTLFFVAWTGRCPDCGSELLYDTADKLVCPRCAHDRCVGDSRRTAQPEVTAVVPARR